MFLVSHSYKGSTFYRGTVLKYYTYSMGSKGTFCKAHTKVQKASMRKLIILQKLVSQKMSQKGSFHLPAKVVPCIGNLALSEQIRHNSHQFRHTKIIWKYNPECIEYISLPVPGLEFCLVITDSYKLPFSCYVSGKNGLVMPVCGS